MVLYGQYLYNPVKLEESALCLDCGWAARREYTGRGKVFRLACQHAKLTAHDVMFRETRGQTIHGSGVLPNDAEAKE